MSFEVWRRWWELFSKSQAALEPCQTGVSDFIYLAVFNHGDKPAIPNAPTSRLNVKRFAKFTCDISIITFSSSSPKVPSISVNMASSTSTPTPPDPPAEDEDNAADLPMTMAASVVLENLPKDAHRALETAGELRDANGELKGKGESR